MAGTMKVSRMLCGLFIGSLPGWADADGYVGSRACAGCHRAISETYSKTGMARTLHLPGGEEPRRPVTVFSQALNRHYQVFRNGGGLYQSQYELDPAGRVVFKTSHKIEYVVGSGANGHSYIVRRGGQLFQAPLSFYSKSLTWDLSPGYEQKDMGFSRQIQPVCMSCHGGWQSAGELGVGCENCHGPGQSHVAQAGKGAIVNPAKLPPPLAEDICMKCHQDGDARVLQPGKEYSDFRPGSPLHETVAILKIPPTRDGVDSSDLLEHHFAMKLSRCYLGSGGKLGCLSCHDPHSSPARTYYRGKCLNCHSDGGCSLPLEKRLPANDCAGCHMPKRQVKGISHSALTLHRIVREAGQSYPEAAFRQTSADLPDLIYVNRPEQTAKLPKVTVLQGYAQLLEKQPRYLPSYLKLLDELSGSAHPFVLAALGRKALREGVPERAIPHLSKAIEAGPISDIPYRDLSDALANVGRLEESVRILENGLGMFPYSSVLLKLLSVRYISLKQYPQARRALVRYLDLFPEDSFMREMLRKFDSVR
jgi:hypothetical protein